MLTDADSNEDTKSTSLLADVTDDSCSLEYTEIAPLTRDTNGPCTTDCASGDWSAQVRQENLTAVKQEPQDVCCTHCADFIKLSKVLRCSGYRPISITPIFARLMKKSNYQGLLLSHLHSSWQQSVISRSVHFSSYTGSTTAQSIMYF